MTTASTATFADDSEVVRVVANLFMRAFAEPQLAARMSGTGVVLQLDCLDPHATIVIDLPGQRVHAGADPAIRPTARIEAAAADFNRYWQGQLNLTQAIAEGSVVIEGGIAPLLARGPTPAELRQSYRDVLVEAGREDLLL